MSLTFDEFGNPFIIIREQDKKQRIKGLDAIRVCFGTVGMLIVVGEYSGGANPLLHAENVSGTEGCMVVCFG